jgi:3',5'-cyclic AMP phosphodiesterase CpdA
MTGDITDHNTAAEHEQFLALLEDFQVPTFVVGGNHDTGGRVYNDHSDMLLYYGTPYYCFDFGPHHYVGIDNATRFFDGPQVRWIKEDLNQAMSRPMRVIFGHCLYLQSEEDKHWFENVLFEENDVALYLYGHLHRDIETELRDGRTRWVCSAAAVDTGRYTVVRIEDHQVVSVEFR